MSDISIKYNPEYIEKKIYDLWMNNNYFSSFPDKRVPYTIIMPPPNVTGSLHIGHMLNNTIQDVLIRYARMHNHNACWIPGTDHASIATEAKVIEELNKKGISKFFLGREKFLSHVIKWSEKYKNIIFNQIKKLGCSCDWNRVQFTMSKKLSESVKKIFINLYNRGYIYRGYHVVNWDTVAKTTISDEEVIHEEQTCKLYYIKYKIKDENNNITIATTRPETLFGDTAVCYNYNDIRYSHLIGKFVIVPIINKVIPIIRDSCIDINFGTGCLKVTPAHDKKDKQLADKYGLEIINIFNEDGTINENGFHYKGIDRFDARIKVVNELTRLDLLEKTEKYKHKIAISERTSSIIEYRLSIQWFLKMKEISIPAMEAVKNNDIKFYPKKIKKIYIKWMNNIGDWNISRQLWWGHRLPVFYYGKKINEYVVAENINIALKKAIDKSNNHMLTYDNLWKDPDVLDTWFSSWILPITGFDGIINPNNEEMDYYYPTEDIVTGSDIIFFWVARMIVSGFFFKNKKPFKRVFFTGIVRDINNKKISKSLNNSPDPIILIKKYGADAVRLGLMLKNTAGKDFHFDEKICVQGRNFANKIWNAFRLIKSWKVEEKKNECNKENSINKLEKLSLLAIEWMNNRFYFILKIFDENFQKYRLDESLMIVYKFFWVDFCSWFLEIIKPDNGKIISSKVYLNVVFYFENILKLLHPYIPFISEEIWILLKKRKYKENLMLSFWPKKKCYDYNILVSFEKVTKIISKIRNLRLKHNIPYKEKTILFSMRNKCNKEKKYDDIILKLANISKIITVSKVPNESSLVSFFLGEDKFFLFLNNRKISNISSIIISTEKKIQYFNRLLFMIRKNLMNKKYIISVPKKILLKEKKKEKDTLEKIEKLKEQIKYFKGKKEQK
ncbi:valine--tRNA ligase [Blattabacterium cuenoti]|uniref:valine--tRNA ligase n=1 Tax=Blattabacterium cuenoti TaxID=1653831 RepID=UPI00163CFDA2|nr:valine--tRNA ligase [Blattabacterium cuenoti]